MDAPVTVLRVYWTWPGVSASTNSRVGVPKYRYATSIVMPCSRSARRPSTSSDRSGVDIPLSTDARSTASIWSASTDFVS